MISVLLFLFTGMTLAAVGSLTLGSPEESLRAVSFLTGSAARLFITGLTAMACGITVTVIYGPLADGLQAIMSVFGYLLTVAGLLMCAIPTEFSGLIHKWASRPGVLLIAPMICLSLGFFMMLSSFLMWP